MFDETASAAALSRYVRETAPVLVLQLDAAGCVTAANALARQTFPGGFVGRPLAEQIVDFNHTLDLPARLRQGDAVVHPLTVSTGAGMPETLDFRFFPVPGGTLALASLDFKEQQKLRSEVLGLNRELNHVTRQLHQANAELRELNQLKNQFLGMAAHDLRAPVGLIISYSEFVLDEAGETLSAEHRKFIETCRAAAASMQQLIENFLDVSVIESGQLQLELTAVSGAEILAGVGPIAQLLAARKKIVLQVESPDAARRLRGDAAKLQQVLLNLISNAVQHSVPGQRVWLAARWEDSQLVFSVRDEGPGLTPEDQARLFAAFGRAGTKKTAGERSTGLGLAIARQVVEAHGGRIWVESVPGHGATFLFSLPIQPEPT